MVAASALLDAVTGLKNPSSIKKPHSGEAAERYFCEPGMCVFVSAGMRVPLLTAL